jgi:antitoxin MazE
MRARVQKWGNSLALRLPKSVADHAGLEQGAEVEINLEDGRFVVSAVPKPAFTLDELLARVTPSNRHRPEDWDSPQGNEAW